MGKRSKREEPKVEDNNFAKDVEKATEPFMERARQIKEEVTMATSDLKQTVDKNNDTIRDKTERLMEAGDKFTKEAAEILRPENDEPEVISLRSRYGLRGTKLYLILATIVMVAILVVVVLFKLSQ